MFQAGQSPQRFDNQVVAGSPLLIDNKPNTTSISLFNQPSLACISASRLLIQKRVIHCVCVIHETVQVISFTQDDLTVFKGASTTC
jgi:hypothetical protein